MVIAATPLTVSSPRLATNRIAERALPVRVPDHDRTKLLQDKQRLPRAANDMDGDACGDGQLHETEKKTD